MASSNNASFFNPYADGITYKFDNGDISVERNPINTGKYQAIHTVKAGETLHSIAFKYYGDSGRWVEIADVNSIYFYFRDLKPGMKLFIP